jgi:hypothetical protein
MTAHGPRMSPSVGAVRPSLAETDRRRELAVNDHGGARPRHRDRILWVNLAMATTKRCARARSGQRKTRLSHKSL